MTEYLVGLGYVLGDIDYCILTHLDIDHAGGFRLVKDAKKIMDSEVEVEAAGKLHVRYRKCLWEDVKIRAFPNGINKIDELEKKPRCPFVLYVGRKKLIKRKEFEQFISENIEL